MKIEDISWTLSPSMTGYKNKEEFKYQRTRIFKEHGGRESRISLGTHAGTHVDAPSHMLEDGENIESINLGKLIGQALILDLTDINHVVTSEDLDKYINVLKKYIKSDVDKDQLLKDKVLILKTKNSNLSTDALFEANFVYVDQSAAQYCVDNNIKALGIDYLGIERNQPDHPTHKILLKNNISIIEGLRLKNITPEKIKQNRYYFVCLPLKIEGFDGAPARAILMENL